MKAIIDYNDGSLVVVDEPNAYMIPLVDLNEWGEGTLKDSTKTPIMDVRVDWYDEDDALVYVANVILSPRGVATGTKEERQIHDLIVVGNYKEFENRISNDFVKDTLDSIYDKLGWDKHFLLSETAERLCKTLKAKTLEATGSTEFTDIDVSIEFRRLIEEMLTEDLSFWREGICK